MNILLICKLAQHTLTENVLLPLLSSNSEHKIYVLREQEGDHHDRVEYIVPKSKAKGQLKHLSKITTGLKVIREKNIDVIIGVLNMPHGLIGRTLGFLTRKPYIHMTIAGHREFWMHGKFIEKVNLKLFGSAAAITVTGSQTKQYLLSHKIKESKINILPNLPNKKFAEVPLQSERKYDIVSFSRIDKNKNVILLIKALARLQGKYSIKVAIAGDGEQTQTVLQAAKDLGVDKLIDYMGYVSGFDKKVEILSNSKIFISCSKGEGFPVSLLEAMNCGCVPVVSNVGDIIDVIHNEENGYVFENTDDEQEFTNYLEKLLQNEELLRRMSNSAYSIRKEISIESNGKIWSKIFNDISQKRGKR